jgi:hypothetical protein
MWAASGSGIAAFRYSLRPRDRLAAMATAKLDVHVRAPSKSQLKRLAAAHTKAEDALRQAEMKAFLAKKKTGKRPYK